ncbi:MAG TPA: aminodeoxychorismate/anthranilate synthase component II, partial [Ignavibacteriales bacterium]|nr:aminodeoxychorismate/anthranilate synthase component II [Ignavibacteriales bacterium]
KISVKQMEEINPDYIVISPGPGTPSAAGITEKLIQNLGGKIPILGVCLGHQAIAEVFGGKVVKANVPMHGKTSIIEHNGKGIFENLPSPMQVGRYHSLIVSQEDIPSSLAVTARAMDGEIMALEYRELALAGVQFHPESVLTPQGMDMLKNFLHYYKKEKHAASAI